MVVPVPAHKVVTVAVAVPPAGGGFIINVVDAVLVQVSLLYVYIIVTVPKDVPVTIPSGVIVAVPVPEVIDHVPPDIESVNAGVDPLRHTADAPPLIGGIVKVYIVIESETVLLLQQVPLNSLA